MKTDSKIALSECVKEYLDASTEVVPHAVMRAVHAVRSVEAYFGGERDIRTITSDDARSYREWLACGCGYHENTSRQLCRLACCFFSWALSRHAACANPFFEWRRWADAPTKPLADESEVEG